MFVREVLDILRVFDDVADSMASEPSTEHKEMVEAWESMQRHRASTRDIYAVMKEGMSLTQHECLDDFFAETIMCVKTHHKVKCVLKLYSIFVG